MTISARLTFAVALSLCIFAGRGFPSAAGQSAAVARPEALADGKRLYDIHCANCHGARAQGAVKAGFEISIISERGGVLRMQIPGLFHPLNEITFNPAARAGDPDWRVMYLGVGDSGTGERQGPMRMHAQRLDTLHGKILRIIPMLSEHVKTSTVSESGHYRIPNDNPFVSVEGARKEIWALGLRNPHA